MSTLALPSSGHQISLPRLSPPCASPIVSGQALARSIATFFRQDTRAPYGGEEFRLSQSELLQAIARSLFNGDCVGYISAPGGVGKTRQIIFLAEQAQKLGIRSLILVPSQLAVKNMLDEIRKIAPDLRPGAVYQYAKQFDGDPVIFTYQSYVEWLSKSRPTDRLYPEEIGLILNDEVHHYLTELSISLRHRFAHALHLGFTATPKYYVGKECATQFGECMGEIDLPTAIERREVTTLNNRIIQTDISLDLNAIVHRPSDVTDDSEAIRRLIDTDPWNKLLAELYRDYRDPASGEAILGQRGFIFCAGILHAQHAAEKINRVLNPLLNDSHFQALCRKNGIDPTAITQLATPIWGDMPAEEKIKILADYRAGRTLILTSAKLLGEAVNEPLTSFVMNGVVTYSFVNAGQRGYRGSRLHPQKENWTVLDILPVNWRDLRIPPVLFGEFLLTDKENAEGIIVDAPKGSTSEEDISPEVVPAQTLSFKIIWREIETLRIARDFKAQRTKAEPLPEPPPNFVSVELSRRRLLIEGKTIAAPQFRALFASIEKERRDLGEPLSLPRKGSHGINALFADTPRGGTAIYLEQTELTAYAATQGWITPFVRLNKPPAGFVSIYALTTHVHKAGYALSSKTLKDYFAPMEAEYDRQRRFTKSDAHDEPIVIEGIQILKASVVAASTLLHVRPEEAIPKLLKELSPLKRPSRSLPLAPSGFISERIARTLCSSYVDYTAHIRDLFLELEEEYLQQAESMPANAILTSRKGIPIIFATSRSRGGPQIYAKQEELIAFVEQLKLEKRLPECPAGFTTLTAVASQFYIPFRDEGLIDLLAEDLSALFVSQSPPSEDVAMSIITSPEGIRVTIAGSAQGNLLHVNSKDAELYFSEVLKYEKKLPQAPEGFYSASQVFLNLKEQGYIPNYASLKNIFKALASEIPPSHPQGECHTTTSGVQVVIAGSNRGNILYASPNIVQLVINTCKLEKRSIARLPSFPQGYLPITPALALFRKRYISGVAVITALYQQLAARYDVQMESVPESNRHTSPIVIDGIRVIRGSSTMSPNSLCIAEEDLKHIVPRYLHLRKLPQQAPLSYLNPTAAHKLLETMGLLVKSNTEYQDFIAGLIAEFESHRVGAEGEQEQSEPFTLSSGIKIFYGCKATIPTYYFDKVTLVANAKRAMNVEGVSVAPEHYAKASHILAQSGLTVSFSVDALFMRSSREYNQHQDSLQREDRHRAPFVTKQGIRVILAKTREKSGTIALHASIDDFIRYSSGT